MVMSLLLSSTMVIKMDNNYWIGRVKELEEAGKFDDEGTCAVCGVQIRGVTAQETYEAQQKHADRHKSLHIILTGFEVIEKTARPHGNGAAVSVPKAWVGKRVKVVLLEPLDSFSTSLKTP